MPTSDFNAPLEKFAKLIDVNLATVVRVITGDLWGMITQRTPVDTGRARASWQVSEGKPSMAAPSPGTYGPPSAVSAGFENISGTQPVYIVSNLDYIEALENGWSKQAPVGMVAISIAEVEARIEILTEKIEKGYV